MSDFRERADDLFRESADEIARLAALSSGPPWILGSRGSPLEAPENTLVGLKRALQLGLDGIGYDVRATQGDELVLMADATLERTTNGRGLVAEAALPKLAALDAGGAFDARFKGEMVPVLEEAITLGRDTERGEVERGAPMHLVHVPERTDMKVVAEALRELARGLSVRVATRSREAAFEARDLGLQALWIAEQTGERERDIAREEKLAAVGIRVMQHAAFEHAPPDWPCERWAIDADEPDVLLSACRMPLTGLTTHEPLRALAARALAQLAPHDDGAWPVQTPELEVVPGSVLSLRGDWSGDWSTSARVRNPFAWSCRVACGLIPRRGAFDIEGVPVAFELRAGEVRDVPFRLRGGSWRTGGDPLFFARYRWRRGPGRDAGSLLVDAPLMRVRTVHADALSQRLVLLRERPDDPAASMTLRRHGRFVHVSIENPGRLRDARAIVHLDGREHLGTRGVRARLPEDFDDRPDGVRFTCGLIAWKDGERTVRRFAGGVPDELDNGTPGRILPLQHG